MDYFEMAADLPRDSYCQRQTNDAVCIYRTQCVMCQLYQQMDLPPHYPLPVIDSPKVVFMVYYCLQLIGEFFNAEIDLG